MKRFVKSLVKEQSGVAMIMVALGMFMLIGFATIVVDAGGLYLEKSRLQKALDAAVLGGAQVLWIPEADAEEVAIEIALKNEFEIPKADVTIGEGFVEIDTKVNKDLTFARVLGFDNTDIRAIARAETTLINRQDAIPVMFERSVLEEGVYGQQYTMHADKNNPNTRGNFGFLAVDGKGASNLLHRIKTGVTIEVGKPETTEPGRMKGPISEAFNSRIDADNGKDYCEDYNTADNTCRRLVTVAVVDTFEVLNGRSDIEIIGLAAFWIEEVDNDGDVIGRFIEFVIDVEYSPGEGYSKTNVKLVK